MATDTFTGKVSTMKIQGSATDGCCRATPKTRERAYLAGPMRGYPLYNFPAFDHFTQHLRTMGIAVISPAEMDREAGFSEHDSYSDEKIQGMMREFMARDLKAIMDPATTAIALMPGWRKSSGVGVELALSRLIGLKVLDAETGQPMSETILQEAQRLVYGDRNKDYGHPRDDFTRTGKMWAAILGVGHVSPEQVALCQIAVKISRECNQPKRDNAVDMAGYAACLQRVKDGD